MKYIEDTLIAFQVIPSTLFTQKTTFN